MNEWKKVKIGEFLFERQGRYKPKDVTIAKLPRLEKIDFSGNFFIGNKVSNTDMILIKSGDLVISGINVAKGAMGVYEGGADITATIHYSSYTFDETKIDIGYFKNFLKSQSFINALKDQARGGIKTEIKPKHLLLLEIDLPNLDIQRKIAKNVFWKYEIQNKYRVELDSQNNYIQNLRQAVLQDAIQGKLTDEWREQNQDIEPAKDLLKKIKSEKERLIKAKELKLGMNTNKSITIRELDLPESWEWSKVDEILFVTKLAGFEYTKNVILKNIGEIPVVRAQNVRPFNLEKTNLLYLDKKTSLLLERCSLTKPCLLATFIGAGIGDVCLFSEKERWHLAPNVAKIEPYKNCENLLDLRFLNFYIMSKSGQYELFKHIKATAQPCLSMSTIRDIDLPIPPLAEQKEIVKKVDQLMKLVSDLEAQVQENKITADLLMQSVLREAFSK